MTYRCAHKAGSGNARLSVIISTDDIRESGKMADDHGLDYLLSLDGESMEQRRGYWVKF